MVQGLIHIYCGDGKGKTSAAVGLAVRAAGRGEKVLFARFLKNEDSGELNVLDAISEIDVIHLDKVYGFFYRLNEEERKKREKHTEICGRKFSSGYPMKHMASWSWMNLWQPGSTG